MQNVPDRDSLIVSFCAGIEAKVLASEVIKVIALDRGQHVQLKADVKEPRFDFYGVAKTIFIRKLLMLSVRFFVLLNLILN